MWRRIFVPVVIGAIGLGLSGCGPRIVLVKGTVTQGGKPIELRKNDSVEVSFVPIDTKPGAAGTLYGARTEADGSFVVLGVHRKGIPQGRYRIDVQVLPNRGDDRLQGKFSGPNSPIIRDVTSSSAEIDIDLDNPGG